MLSYWYWFEPAAADANKLRDTTGGRRSIERMALAAGHHPLVVAVLLPRFDAGEEVHIPAPPGSHRVDIWVQKHPPAP